MYIVYIYTQYIINYMNITITSIYIIALVYKKYTNI